MEEDINRLRRTIGDLRLDNASIIADNEKLKQENERLRKALEGLIHRPPVVCNKCWACGDELAKQALGEDK